MNITLPDSDAFRATTRGGLTLVVPAKDGDMLQLGSWENVSPWLRSVVLDADSGAVRSVGFPKFWNFGQVSGDEAALAAALTDPSLTVRFTEKMDGSLAIRSVIDGTVVFRTRGTFDGGDFGPAMRRVAADRYPVLLDPEFEPDASLLFEFVHPEFRVVIRYDQPDLILLGRVAHTNMTQMPYTDLSVYADAHSLSLVGAHELPRDVVGLSETVQNWTDSEGIVVRVEGAPSDPEVARHFVGGVWLLKLKSLDYLTRHRLRFHLTAKTVREMCQVRDVRSHDDFGRALADIGGDWEMAQDARPLVDAYLAARGQAEARFAALREQVAAAAAEFPIRKDFAISFASRLNGSEKGVAFTLLDGKTDRAWEVLLNATLDQAFINAQAADEALLASEE
jgi:hypothetical protein